MLLRRTRRDIAELIGGVWLAVEIARVVRSRLERPSRHHHLASHGTR